MTFTAAMFQTRQTVVVVHLISNFFHLLPTSCFLPRLFACRFSTSLSPPGSNFPPAIHNIHALYHDLFNLECRRLLLLRVLYRSTGVNFTVDATTGLRASTPFHLADFISNDGRQLISFFQLRCRPSLHSEVRPH